MYESKIKGKKLLRRLCPTFMSSIKWIQADYDIDNGTRIGLNSSNIRDEIRTPNPTKLQLIKLQNVLQICNYIIHKNRIFPYFENEVKNLSNIIIMMMMMMIIIIIVIIIMMIRKVIIKKWIKRKGTYCSLSCNLF